MDKKCRMKVDDISRDWVSSLPDEIIHHIFSFITLQEAGRTCILSHRWRDLWKTTVSSMPDLCLDSHNVMGRDYSRKKFRMKSRMTIAEKKSLQNERYKFVKRVNHILERHKSLVMNSFKIGFHLDIGCSLEIDRWIELAIIKKAMEIDINLSEFRNYRYLNPSLDELYNFSDWVFPKGATSFVKYLSLNSCILMPPKDFCGFSFLLELRLETVHIFDENVENILSNSPLLQRLSLINCWKLERVRIAGTNLVLKYLIVAECYSLEKIEIDAINLTKFEYFGTPVGLEFKNVTQLVNVVIYTVQQNIVAGMSYALGTLSSDLPQLKSLLLHTETIERSVIPARLPTLANLKQLILMVSWVKGHLFGFFIILRATQCLERFELHLPFDVRVKKGKRAGKPSTCLMPHLKEVVMSGLVCSHVEIDFLTHLVRNAEAIKTVTIVPADITYHYDTGVHECVDDNLNRSAADNAAFKAGKRFTAAAVGKEIEKVLPAGANVIIA